MTRVLATVLAAAAIFPGTSRQLAPTAKEVGFTTVAAFSKAKRPAPDKAAGWKNGVAALYTRGTAKAPINALATIYVYSGSTTAARAWRNACKKCATQSAPAGIKLKAEAGRSNGLLTLHVVAACANVYLDVSVQGAEPATKLDTDYAKITNAVLVRARHFGLSSCRAT